MIAQRQRPYRIPVSIESIHLLASAYARAAQATSCISYDCIRYLASCIPYPVSRILEPPRVALYLFVCCVSLLTVCSRPGDHSLILSATRRLQRMNLERRSKCGTVRSRHVNGCSADVSRTTVR